MNIGKRKRMKKTTNRQFRLLVDEIRTHPDLARGANVFGSRKASVDEKWHEITRKLNAIGPPERTMSEWKKVFADFKLRTKKRKEVEQSFLSEIADNKFETSGSNSPIMQGDANEIQSADPLTILPSVEEPLCKIEITDDDVLHFPRPDSPKGFTFGLAMPTSNIPEMQPDVQLINAAFEPTASSPTFLESEIPEPSCSSANQKVKFKRQTEAKNLLRKHVENEVKCLQVLTDIKAIGERQATALERIAAAAEGFLQRMSHSNETQVSKEETDTKRKKKVQY